jgi:hypothetical protein
MSAIDDRYSKLGGAEGCLGKPTTDEEICPDGTGRCRRYNGGSIYWHTNTGAHEIMGSIDTYWADQEGAEGPLGYPMSDELKTSDGGRYSIFEGGVVYSNPEGSAGLAFNMDIPPGTIIQAIDAEVEKIIEETPLCFSGDTQMAAVHRWQDHDGKRYYRTMQLNFDMEAEVRGTKFHPMVDLELHFAFEAKEGDVTVTLVKENHFIVSEGPADAPTQWKDRLGSGFEGWKQKLDTGLNDWREKLHSGPDDTRQILREGFEDTKDMLKAGFEDTKDMLNLGFEEVVDSLVDRRLSAQLGKTIGKSVTIPAGANLLAAQLQNDGSLRLFYGD